MLHYNLGRDWRNNKLHKGEIDIAFFFKKHNKKLLTK